MENRTLESVKKFNGWIDWIDDIQLKLEFAINLTSLLWNYVGDLRNDVEEMKKNESKNSPRFFLSQLVVENNLSATISHLLTSLYDLELRLKEINGSFDELMDKLGKKTGLWNSLPT